MHRSLTRVINNAMLHSLWCFCSKEHRFANERQEEEYDILRHSSLLIDDSKKQISCKGNRKRQFNSASALLLLLNISTDFVTSIFLELFRESVSLFLCLIFLCSVVLSFVQFLVSPAKRFCLLLSTVKHGSSYAVRLNDKPVQVSLQFCEEIAINRLVQNRAR